MTMMMMTTTTTTTTTMMMMMMMTSKIAMIVVADVDDRMALCSSWALSTEARPPSHPRSTRTLEVISQSDWPSSSFRSPLNRR
eukprot:2054453-Rhodomonas_salina.3